MELRVGFDYRDQYDGGLPNRISDGIFLNDSSRGLLANVLLKVKPAANQVSGRKEKR